MHSAAFAVQCLRAGCHRTPCGDVSEPDHCCNSDRSALNGYSRSFIAGKGAAAHIREPQWPAAVALRSRFSHNVPQQHCAFQMTLASSNPFEDAENVASTSSAGSAARQPKQDSLAQERAHAVPIEEEPGITVDTTYPSVRGAASLPDTCPHVLRSCPASPCAAADPAAQDPASSTLTVRA